MSRSLREAPQAPSRIIKDLIHTVLISALNNFIILKKTINMSTNFQFINLDYLDLMSDGDEDMKQTMIEMLLEEIPEEMEQMRVLNDEGNWKELREVSHKMKSTLSFVGNQEMTAANQQVEDIAKAGEGTDALPGLLAILFDLYPKVLEELRTIAAATH